MFGISFGELLVLAVVSLLVLGPERLPQTLRAVGRAMREFRKATNEIRRQVDLDGLMRDVEREPVKSSQTRPWEAGTSRIYPPEGPDLEDVLPEDSPYPP